MRGDDSNLFLVSFIVGVVIFGFLSLGLIIFHEGFFDNSSLNFINSGNSANVTVHTSNSARSNGCELIDARWEKGGKQISSVVTGDSVKLVVESNECEKMVVNTAVYRLNGTSLLVDSFSSNLVDGKTYVSWSTDVEGVYYFKVIVNSSLNIESDKIEFTNVPLLRDSLLCNGFGDDRDYLYDVDINVSLKSNGYETFTASLDGKSLRVNSEEDRFFYDNSNGVLNIDYDIIPSCGGLDIVYTVDNPSSQSQPLPDFLFGGFRQDKVNPKYLELRRGGFLTSSGASNFYAEAYPSTFVYSPITLIVSDNLAQGSSIQYPFMDYNVLVIPQLSWSNDGKVAYRYSFTYPFVSESVKAKIPANKKETYTVSVRFSPSRNWILTLDPYKKFFDKTYPKTGTKDLHPVGGISEAFTEYVNDSNPRGYNYWFNPGKRLDLDGWSSEVTRLISVLSSKGYKRLMIWQTAGMYDPKLCNCNFPAQYMDWLPKLVETQSELVRIKNAGITLGFWWGRSGQVVVPNTWPPASISNIISANYSNSQHYAYLKNQFDLGKQRGADTIGLDSFSFMEPYGRKLWLDELVSSNLKFIHEHGGADIFHSEAANFYTDDYENGKWQTIAGPSLLSWYLNPQSEVWAYEVASSSELNALGQSGMKARAEKLAKWGYTYVDNGLFLDVNNLNIKMSECLDGKDNNGDGLVDWPRDPGCADEFDESE